MAGKKKRCGAEEHEKRLQEVIDRISRGEKRWRITVWMREKFGLSHHAVGRYMTLAHKRMRGEFARPKPDHLEEQYWAYRVVYEDPNTTAAVKLRARELMGRLLGLEAPTKVAATTPDGETAYRTAVESATDEELMALAALKSRWEQAARDQEQRDVLAAALGDQD